MRYGEETIEQIREAAGLVELIGSSVALRKVGQTWKGLCPFHNEKTPSFTVNPDRQAYHCFGCGAGGDCFRFVMETEKLSFVEAVQALAERYGVTLPQPAEEEQNGQVYRALEEAAVFYRRTLEDPETGRAVRAYLADRGVSPASQENYGVGLAPDGWDGLSQRLLPRFGAAVLLEAGLVIRREKGDGVYDRFRNRIVVPLRLPTGRVIGFGGRAQGDDQPKYLNSPETVVYRKGRFLYGLDRARAAMRAREEAVLVEGYFDVIALAQAGIEETVATAGTALTPEQCRLLRRAVPSVALVFDGDAAGQAAAEKALVPCMAAGLAARVVILPAGEDPDTLVRSGGRAAFDGLAAQALGPVAFLAVRHEGDREAALRACARLAAASDDPIKGALLTEEAARVLSFDGAALGREVDALRGGGAARGAARPAAPAAAPPVVRRAPTAPRERAARALEAGFLAVLVAHPELLDEAARHVEPAWFRSAECRALATALLGPERRETAALLGDPELAEPVRGLLSELLATAAPVADPARALAEGVNRLRGRSLGDDQAAIQAEMRRVDGTTPGAQEAMMQLQRQLYDKAAASRALASEARRKERA